MPGHLCIFEDDLFANFYPLTYLRPVYALRCGLFTLRERLEWALADAHGAGDAVSVICRTNLNPSQREAGLHPLASAFSVDAPTLFVNGAVIDAYALAAQLAEMPEVNTLFATGGRVIAARLDAELARGFAYYAIDQDMAGAREALGGAVRLVEVDVCMAAYPWDLIGHNAAMIAADFDRARPQMGGMRGEVDSRAALYNPADIHIAPGARVDALAVLDARDGPISLGAEARVQPFSYIQGPACIGAGTLIVGGQMREGTCIGPMCRVGGEVEETIIQGYSNKYHAGFLGHSYLGEWVNIGAIATNSDLKNTYSNIRMEVNNAVVDTGRMKMGVVLGDHVKVGIGVMLVGGASVGVGSNIMNGMAPKVVPCFVWSDGQTAAEYNLDQFLAVAERAMSRRKVALSTSAANLLRHVFYQTKPQRQPAR